MTDYEDYQIEKYADDYPFPNELIEDFEKANKAMKAAIAGADTMIQVKPYNEFTYEEIFDEEGEITPEFDIAQWRHIRELVDKLGKAWAIVALEKALAK